NRTRPAPAYRGRPQRRSDTPKAARSVASFPETFGENADPVLDRLRRIETEILAETRADDLNAARHAVVQPGRHRRRRQAEIVHRIEHALLAHHLPHPVRAA